MLPPPENFIYNPANGILSWESIPGALEYMIEFSLIQNENWISIYFGPLTSCPFGRPSGTYKVRGRTKDNDDWSGPGKPKIIVVT
jgi:hypothetical protein